MRYFLINFLLILPEYKEENAYLRGRIDELSRQLNNSNDELRDLRHEIGKVTSHNETLFQENDNLRELHSRKGHRRPQDHESSVNNESEEESREIKRRRKVRHSSSEEEEEVDETARVRLKFFLKFTYFQVC